MVRIWEMGYKSVMSYDMITISHVNDMITISDITLWFFIIAMENGPFIEDVPIKTTIYRGFSMAMLVITRWYHHRSEHFALAELPAGELQVGQVGPMERCSPRVSGFHITDQVSAMRGPRVYESVNVP